METNNIKQTERIIKIPFLLKLFIFTLISMIGMNAIGQVFKTDNNIKVNRSTKNDSLMIAISENNEESYLYLYNNQPSFGMYRDNYFITGIPTNKKVSSNTANAKFQISIQQRLTKAVLPYNTFLLLTYTQKSFWDIYKYSAPFTDNNYNPGLAITKTFVKNKKLKSVGSIAFEHESNGKDSLQSRSWNYFVLSYSYFFNTTFSVQSKIWMGWLGNENDDLYDYRGHGLIALNYKSLNDRFRFSAIVNPRNCIKNINTQLEINYRIAEKANQFLFLQWYNGYGESLLEYDDYTSMVRIGICIKPQSQNFY